MMLSDRDIKKAVGEGDIAINPYDVDNVQAATVDLKLGSSFQIPNYESEAGNRGVISLDEKISYFQVEKDEIVILPKHFILGTTFETIGLAPDLAARVDGKSSIGRKGLFIQNAGHITPGFKGQITLEMYNANDLAIRLKSGELICQIEFHKLSSEADNPYTGQYQGQKGAGV